MPGADRIELQLRVDFVIVWQRAIFYSPPTEAALGEVDHG
jgi:hypothetical protein